MRTIWHSLAWKEWHEHKWKLVSLTAILIGVSLLIISDNDHDALGFTGAMLLSCIIPLAVFIGLGAAANERSRGTLRFLQALPIPMRRVAMHKLAFGMVTLVVPILVTLLLILAWWFRLSAIDATMATRLLHDAPFTENWFADMAFMAVLGGLSLYIWSAAAGVNRRDEVSAGAAALIIMVGYWLVLVMLWSVLLLRSTGNETARLRAVAVGTAPGSGFTLGAIAKQDGPAAITLGTIAAFVAHGYLAMRYVRRFGETTEQEIRSPQAARTAAGFDLLAPPRRSAMTAIAWKQVRESGPIVLAGLAGIVGVFVVFMASIWPEAAGQIKIEDIFAIFGGISLVFGFVIALVVGIGVCLYDTSPKLNAFWRSRPINADAWYWTKFCTGLAVLLVAVYLPLVFIASLAQLHTSQALWNSNEVYLFPLVHVAVFAAAVAMTCLVRHAVYAAILSIPMLNSGILLVGTALVVGRVAGWLDAPIGDDLWQMSELQIAVGFVVSTAISTVMAWLAVRNDWGWKSRY